MDPLLNEAIDTWCSPGAQLLVALDFDGTLAPFVDDPQDARPVPQADRAIRQLASGRANIAFVSGRQLTDLLERVDPPVGSFLVGSHGAEDGHLASDGIRANFVTLDPDLFAVLQRLVADLRDVATGHPGAWVQVKPSAAVMHTRQAAPEEARSVTSEAVAVAERLGLSAMQGKDVVEIAVVPTSKGIALQRLRDRLEQENGPCRILFAGDDTTDEAGFAVLGAGDIGIKVGDGPTGAQFTVAGPVDLAEVLTVVSARLLA